MTTVIPCPYCSQTMLYRELGHVNKHCFYECPHCLSRSPLTFNEVNANSMARMRNRKSKPSKE